MHYAVYRTILHAVCSILQEKLHDRELSNSKLFWAKIRTNGDISVGLSETCGFSKLEKIFGRNLDKWRYSGWYEAHQRKNVVFPNSKLFLANGDIPPASH